MKNKMLNSLKSWGLPIAILIFITLFFNTFICFFPKWLSGKYFEIFPQSITHQNILTSSTSTTNKIEITPSITGTIGDTFGGTLGPVIAIVAAFLTFLAFWIQYKANEQQKIYINQQRFEDTFFRLLDNYQKIVDSIDIRDGKDVSKIKASGRESFKRMYQDLSTLVADTKTTENINLQYNIIQEKYNHDLHHYFRFIYHILKFIKYAEISESQKLKYSSILRATLSSHELILIFYNGLHKYGKSHFKPLIEEFSFLKNVHEPLLLNQDQKNDYNPLAYANSTERASLLSQWKEKSKK